MQTKKVFHENWWLDACVGKNNWDQITYESNGHKIFWPFYKKSFLGLKLLKQPQLTPFLGPWFESKENKELNYGKYDELLLNAFYSLPKHDLINQCLGRELNDSFILSLKKINHTILYTYILQVSNEKILWGNYSKSLKRDIKYAIKANIKVKVEDDFNILNDLSNITFEAKSIVRPYDKFYLESIYREATDRKRSKLYIARNNKNKPCSCALILNDENCSYYLIGGQDRSIEESNHSVKLLLHNAILDSFYSKKKFDFEGSMNPSIEKFFRGFGGKRTPYICLRNINNKYLKIIDFIRRNLT